MPITRLEKDWLDLLQPEFAATYMQSLKAFIAAERQADKTIYPASGDIFNALNVTRLEKVKVVIIGQDPYHGEGQAHGLSFSVPTGVKIPPSLRNIYKEIEAEYGYRMPHTGDLTGWAEQGVLLLNATLTVEAGMAGSHQKRGWELFTDAVIRVVNEKCNHVVFMLWGAYAQKKGAHIDRSKHLVLESVHPSPLSAHRGFLGNGHFKSANDYLEANGRQPIDWQAI